MGRLGLGYGQGLEAGLGLGSGSGGWVRVRVRVWGQGLGSGSGVRVWRLLARHRIFSSPSGAGYPLLCLEVDCEGLNRRFLLFVAITKRGLGLLMRAYRQLQQGRPQGQCVQARCS